MKYKSFKHDNYNVQTVKVDNFRLNEFKVIFKSPLCDEDSVCFSLLSDIMTESTKKYPSPKMLTRYLENSQIISLYGSSNPSCKCITTIFSVELLDPKYVKNKNYLENSIKFLFDVIKNPNVDKELFDENVFNYCKKSLIKYINNLEKDDRYISSIKSIKFLDQQNVIYKPLVDMKEYVSQIKNEDLYKFYKKLLNQSSVDIFYTGSCDGEKIDKIVSNAMNLEIGKYKKYKNEPIFNKRMMVRSKYEKSNLKQSIVTAFYTYNNLSKFEKEYVLPFYINILNGGLNSKLYINLREDNSLCYSVSTRRIDSTNVLQVKSFIKAGEEKKAIKLIKKSFNQMKYRISGDEFIRAYYSYRSSLKEMIDSIGAITRFYQNVHFEDKDDYNEKIKKFNKVTIEDVYELSNKIHLNTIHVLKGDINERNED